MLVKQSVEQWLKELFYTEDPNYVPSTFALNFVNFIKLVNGGQGEENKTPTIHMKMLDNVAGTKQNIVNLCSRGLGKTTVMCEYMILYIAVFGGIDGFGKIPLGIYVSDSIENGVKNMRKNLEYRWENSEFLQKYVPNTRFTDVRWEFINVDGVKTVLKGYGGKALSLDTRLHTHNGYTTIKDCYVGQKIFSPDGKLHTITAKSEVFDKPMYKLLLEDGRFLEVSEDHINSVMVNTNPNNTARWEEKDLTTKELLSIGWLHTKKGNKNHKGISNKCTVKIKSTEPLEYPEKNLTLDPYTLGLILGDGSVKKKASGVVLTGLLADTDFYRGYIPYDQGNDYIDKRTKDTNTFAIKGINQKIRDLYLDVHGRDKFIPEEYMTASVSQRLELLKGLLDTDGSVFGEGRITFVSASKKLVQNTASLVRSLGGKAKFSVVSPNAFQIEIWIGVNPFKLPRKADKFKIKRNWNTLNVVDISRIEDKPSQCIAIDSPNHQYLAGEYFRTHNTGVRGTKEMGQRPYIALLDDLISDEDARSATVRASIEDTVYKAIDYALHPKRRKTIWSGTPFNANDPLYKAVESGAWHVNVYPICEEFPCKKEDFKGAWEDRFPYEYVNTQYLKALRAGRVDTFNQELMLRIMSDEDRLVKQTDIMWYKRSLVFQNKDAFNFYITTDFATSERQKADFSVISVWAYNNNGDWFWVDGICKRQSMDVNVDDLFKFCSLYKPLNVGVEVSGQQSGFIPWIKEEMLRRNIFFTLASDSNNGLEGIRPVTNKLARFNTVVPLFRSKKIYFPEELKESDIMREAMDEILNVSMGGIKSRRDDFLDTVSMILLLSAWKPSEDSPMEHYNQETHLWEEDENEDIISSASYIV